MSATEETGSHAALMDGVYRRQRHFYDLTRKYYLLGRDRLLAELRPPEAGTILEIGCGTGRNLAQAAKLYPQARLHGLDISAEMLASAAQTLERRGIAHKIRLARADATDFDPEFLFGQSGFDRIFISYALSMIPDWEGTLASSLSALNPGGSLHLVDFGQQERLPALFRRGLQAWLRKFHVTPLADLAQVLNTRAEKLGAECRFVRLYRGYAWLGTVRVPAAAAVSLRENLDTLPAGC